VAEKRAVRLGEVQETLLIPLYGRADQTRRKRGLLHDPKAVEMVEAIDYDFGRFDGGRSLLGATVRTCILDVWVREFLSEHPAGTVVEIGAGLNTRFERVDNGQVHWIDLDLPDVIDLRGRFFTESDRRRMVAASVLDPGWIAAVQANPGPYFFAAEAVLVYLNEPQVRQALGLIVGQFPGARIALDTAGGWIIANQHRHDTLKTMQARMTWACDDPRELERWGLGLRLRESRDLSQLPPAVRRTVPAGKRAVLTFAHFVLRKRFAGYKVNLLDIEPSTRTTP
jgi:O-methyltransferase involved in polyketide biosynthesis